MTRQRPPAVGIRETGPIECLPAQKMRWNYERNKWTQ